MLVKAALFDRHLAEAATTEPLRPRATRGVAKRAAAIEEQLRTRTIAMIVVGAAEGRAGGLIASLTRMREEGLGLGEVDPQPIDSVERARGVVLEHAAALEQGAGTRQVALSHRVGHRVDAEREAAATIARRARSLKELFRARGNARASEGVVLARLRTPSGLTQLLCRAAFARVPTTAPLRAKRKRR